MKDCTTDHFPSTVSASFASKTLASAPSLDRHDCNVQKPLCRKKRRGTFSSHGLRLRKEGAGVGRKSGPATPLLKWKYEESVPTGESAASGAKALEFERKNYRSEKKSKDGDVSVSISARKLAAGLLQLKLPEPETVSGGCSFSVGHFQKSFQHVLGFEPIGEHVKNPYLCNSNGTEHVKESKDRLKDPLLVLHPKNGICYKIEPSLTFPNSAMERATKWDPGCPKTSHEAYRFYGHLKFLQDQQDTTVSIVSTLQADLEQARAHIHELETERLSSKNKVEQYLRKLAEERASWRSREHEKIRSVLENVKDDLNRERKQRQRVEIMNNKLVSELAEAKSSAKMFLQDYEKERKARELMEEVCDELAKEIGEDRAEMDALKRESMKIREEVEEERKMLQMAEVWREERVQMKLVDAKITLEEKYSQLSKLQADLEVFLISRSTSDSVERETALLREAGNSIKIQEIEEFSYQRPTSGDVFSVFEDLHSSEANGKEIEPCLGFTHHNLASYSPASQASKIHTVSPDINELNGNSIQRYTELIADQNGNLEEEEEDGSCWDSVSPGEEQGSSNSPDGSNPSVNGFHEETNGSRSATEWEENGDNDAQSAEICSAYSECVVQSRTKTSSVSRIWRSSNGEPCKTTSVEVSKGCMEWPRNIQKNSLKAKLLEARMGSQKIQLRHVLKQKI